MLLITSSVPDMKASRPKTFSAGQISGDIWKRLKAVLALTERSVIEVLCDRDNVRKGVKVKSCWMELMS